MQKKGLSRLARFLDNCAFKPGHGAWHGIPANPSPLSTQST
jgi:hypothetical protein